MMVLKSVWVCLSLSKPFAHRNFSSSSVMTSACFLFKPNPSLWRCFISASKDTLNGTKMESINRSTCIWGFPLYQMCLFRPAIIWCSDVVSFSIWSVSTNSGVLHHLQTQFYVFHSCSLFAMLYPLLSQIYTKLCHSQYFLGPSLSFSSCYHFDGANLEKVCEVTKMGDDVGRLNCGGGGSTDRWERSCWVRGREELLSGSKAVMLATSYKCMLAVVQFCFFSITELVKVFTQKVLHYCSDFFWVIIVCSVVVSHFCLKC